MILQEMALFIIENSTILCRCPHFASALKTYGLLETCFNYENGELQLANTIELHAALTYILQDEDSLIAMLNVLKLMKELSSKSYDDLILTQKLKDAVESCGTATAKEKAWIYFFRGEVLNAVIHRMYLSDYFGAYIYQEGVLTTNQRNHLGSKVPINWNSDYCAAHLVDCALKNNTVLNLMKCIRECSLHDFQYLLSVMPVMIRNDIPTELTA